MKEAVLVNTELNLDCMYTIGQSNKMILLKNVLEKNNVTTFQYIESSLPNVIDIVDEILSFTEEAVIFRVTDMNYKLVEKLITLLKEEIEDINIILFGDIAGSIEGIEIFKEDEDYISKVLNKLDIESSNYESKEICSFDDIDGIKECESFTLDLTYDSEVIDLDIIKNNINQVFSKNQNIKIFFETKEIMKLDEDSFNNLVEVIKEIKGNYGLIESGIDDKKYLENIQYSNLIFRANSIEDICNEDSINIRENCEVSIIVKEYDEEKLSSVSEKVMNQLRAAKLRVFISAEDKNFRCVYVNSITGINNLPIENGIMTWYQGTYPPTALNNTVKHIYLSENIESDKLNELDKIASVNHAIISNEKLEDKSVPYSKHNHLIKKGINSNIEICVDSGFFKKTYSEVQYKDVRKVTGNHTDNYILKILDDEDLETFRSDIENFNKTGELPVYMVNGMLKNSCRFLPKGRCQVNSIPRIDIDGKGNISSCDSNYKIGELGNDYFDLMNNIYKKSSEEAINRNCSECSARDKCGACKLLPESMSKEKYCSFIREVENIDKFIISALVIKMLMESSQYFRDKSIEDIKVINKGVSNLFLKESKEKSNGIVKDSVVLIKVHDDVMIFDLVTNNIIGISSLVSYTLEGYMKGYSLEEIKEISKGEFADNDDIEKCIEEATVQLEYSNIIERVA